jgi:hypothetical protein
VAVRNHRIVEYAKTKDDYADHEWRTGRYKTWQASLIYAQLGNKPASGDACIGQMGSPKLAKQVVQEHNGWLD